MPLLEDAPCVTFKSSSLVLVPDGAAQDLLMYSRQHDTNRGLPWINRCKKLLHLRVLLQLFFQWQILVLLVMIILEFLVFLLLSGRVVMLALIILFVILSHILIFHPCITLCFIAISSYMTPKN